MSNQVKLLNPIITSGEDPWVTKYGKDYYYLYSATNDDYLAIKKAGDVNSLQNSEEIIVWKPEASDHDKGMWAPELHQIEGKWYIYFAACDGENKNHRMYVLEADEIPGPYREKGKIADPKNDCWAIDMTVFKHLNKWYAVWSGWKGDYCETDFPQCLYIAPMLNPWTLEKERVMISEPEFDWEKSVQAVNEGPEFYQRNGKTFIIYSANGSWTTKYCLGQLELVGQNPLDPLSWKKKEVPAFIQGNSEIYGPGHACFIKGEGEDEYLVYHAKKSTTEGWDREVRIKPIEWINEELLLGVPV